MLTLLSIQSDQALHIFAKNRKKTALFSTYSKDLNADEMKTINHASSTLHLHAALLVYHMKMQKNKTRIAINMLNLCSM